ncbi:MAG: phosphotransferase [Methylococcaceae bacterium]|nr:phosphotransferase [Methylococcaceae bacterium]
MNENFLVRHPKNLTINWAQRIVDNQANGTKVSKVDIDSIDIGTTTRVRVIVDHDGPKTLPKRWFVKFPSMACRARLITALPRLLHTEVRFYQEIAHLIPVNRPTALAGQSKFGQGATLVLSDITESGAIPGHPGDALSVSQAAMVIEQLAHFHAFFDNKVDCDPSFRWLAASVRRLEDNLGTILAVPLMKRGLQLATNLVPASLFEPIMQYSRCRKQAMNFLSAGAQTLIHHDCHPGNLFWNQSQPGFLDWQLVRIGEGISDVSYFLATALDPEIRRQHEHRLLDTYLQILIEKGNTTFNKDSLLLRYRAHLAYALEAMMVTLAVGGLMPLESNLELIRRTAQAVEDHDVFSVLPI